MAVSHVFSNTVADGTNTGIVRPSDWNSAHNQFLTVTGNTSGQSTFSGSNIVFGAGANITLSGVNATRFDIVGGAGAAGNTGSISAGTASASLGQVVFSNSNGISFGINGQTLTAQHNALTTARASNDAIGLATAQSNVTWTVNSAGLSLDARGYAGTATTFNGANLSGSMTVNSAGVNLSLSAGNYITTARASNDAIGLNTAQSNVTWTVNSSGLSLDARGYAGTGTTFNGANISGSLTVNSAGVQISASVATSLSNIRVSAGTTSNLLSAITFGDANGISFGLNASTLTASHNGLTSQSNQNVTAANGGFAFQTLSFSNANGVSFGTSAGSAITASVQTSYRASNDAIGLNTAQTNVTWTVNSSGLSLNAAGYAGTGTTFNGANVSGSLTQNSNGLQVSLSALAQTNQTIGLYGSSQTTGSASSGTLDARSLSIIGAGLISVGMNSTSAGGTTTGLVISATQSNQAFSAAGGSSAFQTLGFSDNAYASWTNTGGSVALTELRASLFAVSNTTQSSSGTQNLDALSFAGAGLASVGVTNGSVVISVPAGAPSPVNFSAGSTSNNLGSVVFSNLNGVSFGLDGSTITASVNAGAGGGIGAGVSTGGNTAGSTGTVTTGNVVFVGSNGITLSQSTGAAGSAATITVLGYPLASSFDNGVGAVAAYSVTAGATSAAQAFIMPHHGSFSFLRIPATFSGGSTTLATTAATLNASVERYTTWNAVLYSLGTGASSKSLISVPNGSGSNGWTFRNSISVAVNGTQYSITQGFSAHAEGAGTTRTTQYSISNTNYSYTTNQIATEWTGGRMLDIPMAVSLTPGPYWLVVGLSTNSATNSTGVSAASQCAVGFVHLFGRVMTDLSFGVMGSTDRTASGLMGAGSFGTAGGGTTSGFNISAISSRVSNQYLAFQLLRSG